MPPPAEADTQAADAPWRLRLLGGFELDDGQQRLTRLRSRAAMALLARLALAPGRRFERAGLATLLWPEAAAPLARTRLRQTLSLLKAVLEPPGAATVLGADRDAVWAEPDRLWCDATAYQQRTRAGDAEGAAALYRGALMPGFYDEWLLQARQQLETLAEGRSGAAAAAVATSPTAPPPAIGPFGDRLPRDPRPLIGVDNALAALLALARSQRWVTVLGAGGVGKTRLATEAARRLALAEAPAHRLDRALFVPLQQAVNADHLLERLCDCLQLGRPARPQQAVLDALAGRPALLLLDNAEDLADDAVAALAALVEQLPLLRWLATSRRPLGLDGEHSFRLAPLPVPQPEDPVESLAHNPAVQLYLARAREHRADLHLSRRHADELVALLRQLDGLPLAIELAAAQARQAGPAALLARLGAQTAWPQQLRRPPGQRSTAPHHHSLAAVIDGSWQMLTATQRRLLQRLCLPAHGIGSALALRLAAPELSPLAAHAALADLAAQSLLQPLGEGPGRWRIDEPVRAHLLAKLDPASRRAAWGQVADATIAWAANGAGPGQRPDLQAQRAELGNAGQVLAQMLEAGEDTRAAQLIAALSKHQLFALSGPVLDAACAAVDRCTDPALRGPCQSDLSWYLLQAGRRDEARQRAEAGLADDAAAPADPARHCHALTNVVRQRWMDGVPAAELQTLLDEAEAAAHRAGRWGQVGMVSTLRAIMASHDDPPVETLRALHGQAVDAMARWGDRDALCGARYNLAAIELDHGDLAVAAEMLPALCDEARALGNWRTLANASDAMSQVLMRQRRWPEALAMARQGLQLGLRFGLRYTLASALLWNVPRILVRSGRPADAMQLLVFAEALWRRSGSPMSPADERRLAHLQRLAAARVPTPEQTRCLAAGAALDEAAALALVFRD
jgi:predicted ATPase